MDDLVQRLRAIEVSALCDADKGLPVVDPMDFPVGVVSRIITDLAVFDVTPGGLRLLETAPGLDAAQLRGMTGVEFSA